MAPHSSTVAQKIPWMEEPGRLQSMGSLRKSYENASKCGEDLLTSGFTRRWLDGLPAFPGGGP